MKPPFVLSLKAFFDIGVFEAGVATITVNRYNVIFYDVKEEVHMRNLFGND